MMIFMMLKLFQGLAQEATPPLTLMGEVSLLHTTSFKLGHQHHTLYLFLRVWGEFSTSNIQFHLNIQSSPEYQFQYHHFCLVFS